MCKRKFVVILLIICFTADHLKAQDSTKIFPNTPEPIIKFVRYVGHSQEAVCRQSIWGGLETKDEIIVYQSVSEGHLIAIKNPFTCVSKPFIKGQLFTIIYYKGTQDQEGQNISICVIPADSSRRPYAYNPIDNYKYGPPKRDPGKFYY